MPNSLSGAAAATLPGASPPPLAADPAALGRLAGELRQRAAALRSGAPALVAAWQQAAGTLACQHTGGVLAVTWPGSRVALEEFAGSVEALAAALDCSAVSYASAEAAAVPRPATP